MAILSKNYSCIFLAEGDIFPCGKVIYPFGLRYIFASKNEIR